MDAILGDLLEIGINIYNCNSPHKPQEKNSGSHVEGILSIL